MLNTDKKLVVYIVALPCPPVPVPVPSLILSLESGFLALPLSIVALPRRRPPPPLFLRVVRRATTIHFALVRALVVGGGGRRWRIRVEPEVHAYTELLFA